MAESKATVRFLISSPAAGSIIGKGGASITEFQNQSGTKMQVSRNNEFFPGTQERILTMTGTVNAILTALHLILSKLRAEDITAVKADRGEEVKMLVPNQLCGALIGKNGETIRNFINDSQANIKVSNADEMPYGTTDRVVKVLGNLDQILRAVALIVTKLKEDDRFEQLSGQAPYFRGGAGGAPATGGANPPSGGGVGRGTSPSAAAPPANGRPGPAGGRGQGLNVETASIGVPDEVVGHIIGRQGRGMKELQAMLGVQITASQRDEFMGAGRDRRFTITGPADRVKYAEMILQSKIQEELRRKRDEEASGKEGGEGAEPSGAAETAKAE